MFVKGYGQRVHLTRKGFYEGNGNVSTIIPFYEEKLKGC